MYRYMYNMSFKYLFQALVRPHLEYAAAVWSPYKSGEIEQIGNVQRKATKQIPSLKNMEYNQRLRKLNMPTLKYRRARVDMIEVLNFSVQCYYFVLSLIYNFDLMPFSSIIYLWASRGWGL